MRKENRYSFCRGYKPFDTVQPKVLGDNSATHSTSNRREMKCTSTTECSVTSTFLFWCTALSTFGAIISFVELSRGV